MTSEKLLENVIVLYIDDLILYIKDNIDNLRLCFLQANPTKGDDENLHKVISTIAQKQISLSTLYTEEIQTVYIHLAYYFKRFNQKQFVDTCATNIQENVFKKRLSAWLHYKRYNVHSLHITEFEKYITKISAAIHDDEDDYTYEILGDLHDYKTTGLLKLNGDLRSQVLQLFNDSTLQEKYPILKQLHNDPLNILPDLEIEDLKVKIYYPTPFAENVFNQKFMNYVKANRLFGYSIDEATEHIIKKGQANFDVGYEELTAAQVVKIYCYCNMRMHFFSSISLYERSDLIALFYNTSNKLRFIDIGCGPGTCGLALADQIYELTGVEAAFDYYGVDISVTMQVQARELLDNIGFSKENDVRFFKDVRDINTKDLAKSSCIIINTCYVFASEDLPIDLIAEFVSQLKLLYPFTPLYLLFQNPQGAYLNRRYESFKLLLPNFVVTYTKTSLINYCYQRSISATIRPRTVFFEVLKF